MSFRVSMLFFSLWATFSVAQVRHSVDGGRTAIANGPKDCVLHFAIDPRFTPNPKLISFLQSLSEQESADSGGRASLVRQLNTREGIKGRIDSIKSMPDHATDSPNFLKDLLNLSYGLHRVYLAQTLHTQTAERKSTSRNPEGEEVTKVELVPSALSKELAELRALVENKIVEKLSTKKYFIQTDWADKPGVKVLDWSRIFLMPDATKDLMEPLFASERFYKTIPWNDPESLAKWELMAGEKSQLSLLNRVARMFTPAVGDEDLSNVNWLQNAMMREAILNSMEVGNRKRVHEKTKEFPSLLEAFPGMSDKQFADAVLDERQRWCRFFASDVVDNDQALQRLTDQMIGEMEKARKKLEAEGKKPEEIQAEMEKWEDKRTERQQALEPLTSIFALNRFVAAHDRGSPHGLPVEVRAKLEKLSPTARLVLARMARSSIDHKDHENVLRAIYEADDKKLTEGDTRKRLAYQYPPGHELFFTRTTDRKEEFLTGLGSFLGRISATVWDVENCQERADANTIIPSALIFSKWDQFASVTKDQIFLSVLRELNPPRSSELEQKCDEFGTKFRTPESKAKGLLLLEEHVFLSRPQYLVAYYQLIGLYLGWKATPAEIAKDILTHFPGTELDEIKKFRQDQLREGGRFTQLSVAFGGLSRLPAFNTPDQQRDLEALRHKLMGVDDVNFRFSIKTILGTLVESPRLINAFVVTKEGVTLDPAQPQGLGRLVVPQVQTEDLPKPAAPAVPVVPATPTTPEGDAPPEMVQAPAAPAEPPAPVFDARALRERQLAANREHLRSVADSLQNAAIRYPTRKALADYFDAALKTQTGKSLREHFPDRFKNQKAEEVPSEDEIKMVRRLVDHLQASNAERSGIGDLPQYSDDIDYLIRRLLGDKSGVFNREDLQKYLLRLRQELPQIDPMALPFALRVLEATLLKHPKLVLAISVVDHKLIIDPSKMEELAYFEIPAPDIIPGMPISGEQVTQMREDLKKNAALYVEQNQKVAEGFLNDVVKKQGRFAKNDPLQDFFNPHFIARTGRELDKLGGAAARSEDGKRDAIIHQLFLDSVQFKAGQYPIEDLAKLRGEESAPRRAAETQKLFGFVPIPSMADIQDLVNRATAAAKPPDPAEVLKRQLDRFQLTAMALNHQKEKSDPLIYRAVARDVAREGEALKAQAQEFQLEKVPENDAAAKKSHDDRAQLYARADQALDQATEIGSRYGYGLRAGEDTRAFASDTVSVRINGHWVHGVPPAMLKDPEKSQDLYWQKTPADSESCQILFEQKKIDKSLKDLCLGFSGRGQSWIDRVWALYTSGKIREFDIIIGHHRQKYRNALDLPRCDPDPKNEVSDKDSQCIQIRLLLQRNFKIPETGDSDLYWNRYSQAGPNCQELLDQGKLTEEEKVLCDGPTGGGRGGPNYSGWKDKLEALYRRSPEKFGRIVQHYHTRFKADPEKVRKEGAFQAVRSVIDKIFGSHSDARNVIVDISNPSGTTDYSTFPGRIAELQSDPNFAHRFERLRPRIPIRVIGQDWVTKRDAEPQTPLSVDDILKLLTEEANKRALTAEGVGATALDIEKRLKAGDLSAVKAELQALENSAIPEDKQRFAALREYARRLKDWNLLESEVQKYQAQLKAANDRSVADQTKIAAGNESEVRTELERMASSDKAEDIRLLQDLRSIARILPSSSPYRNMVYRAKAPPHLADLMDPVRSPGTAQRFRALVDSLPAQILAEEWLLHDAGILPDDLKTRDEDGNRIALTKRAADDLHQRLELKRKAYFGRISNGSSDPGAEIEVPANTFHTTKEYLYTGVGDHGEWVEGLMKSLIKPAVKSGDLGALVKSVQASLSQFRASITKGKDESDVQFDNRYAKSLTRTVGFFMDQYCVVREDLKDPSKKMVSELWPAISEAFTSNPPSREEKFRMRDALMNVIFIVDGDLAGRRRDLTDGGGESQLTEEAINLLCPQMLANRTSIHSPEMMRSRDQLDRIRTVYTESYDRLARAQKEIQEGDERWIQFYRRREETPETALVDFSGWEGSRVNPHIRILATDSDSWTVNKEKLTATLAALARRRAHLRAGGKLGEPSKDEPANSVYDKTLRDLELREFYRPDQGEPAHTQATQNWGINNFLEKVADGHRLKYGGLSPATAAGIHNLPTPAHDALQYFGRIVDQVLPQDASAQPDAKKRSAENATRKKLALKMARVMEQPFPDDIINLVLSEQRLREGYGKSLDASLWTRYKELQKKQNRSQHEEIEMKMLIWLVNCEGAVTTSNPPGTTRMNIPLGNGRVSQEDRFAGFGKNGQPPFERSCRDYAKKKPKNIDAFNADAPSLGDVFSQIPSMSLEDREKVRGWTARQLILYFKAIGVDLSKESDLIEAAKKAMSRGLSYKRNDWDSDQGKESKVLPNILVTLLWALDAQDKKAGEQSKGAKMVTQQLKAKAENPEFNFDPAVVASREHLLASKLAVGPEQELEDSDKKRREFLDTMVKTRWDGGHSGGLSARARMRLLDMPDHARQKLLELKRKFEYGSEEERRLLQTLIETADPQIISEVAKQKLPSISAQLDRQEFDPAVERKNLIDYFKDHPGEWDKKPDKKMVEKFDRLLQNEYYARYLLPYLDAMGKGLNADGQNGAPPSIDVVKAILLAEIRDAAVRDYFIDRSDAVREKDKAQVGRFGENLPTVSAIYKDDAPLKSMEKYRKLLANPYLFRSKRDVTDLWNVLSKDPEKNKLHIAYLEEVERIRDEDPDTWKTLKDLALIQGIDLAALEHAGPGAQRPDLNELYRRVGHMETAAELEMIRRFRVAETDTSTFMGPHRTEQSKENLFRVWDTVQKKRDDIIEQLLSGKVTLQGHEKCVPETVTTSPEYQEFLTRYRKSVYDRDMRRAQLSEGLQRSIGMVRRLNANLNDGILPQYNLAPAAEKVWLGVERDKLKVNIASAQKDVEVARAELVKHLEDDKKLREQWNTEYMQKRNNELKRREGELSCLFGVAYGDARDRLQRDKRDKSIWMIAKKKLGELHPDWNEDQINEFIKSSFNSGPEMRRILEDFIREELASKNPDLETLASLAFLMNSAPDGGSRLGIQRQEFIEMFAGNLIPPRFLEGRDPFPYRQAMADEIRTFFDERERMRGLAKAVKEHQGTNAKWEEADLIKQDRAFAKPAEGQSSAIGEMTRKTQHAAMEYEMARLKEAGNDLLSAKATLAPLGIDIVDGHLDFAKAKLAGKTEEQIKALLKLVDPHMSRIRGPGQGIDIPISAWDELNGRLSEQFFQSHPRPGQPSIFQFNDHTVVRATYDPKKGEYRYVFLDAAKMKEEGTKLVQEIQKGFTELKDCYLDFRALENSYWQQMKKVFNSSNAPEKRAFCDRLEDELKPKIDRLENEFGALFLDEAGKYSQEVVDDNGKSRMKHRRIAYMEENPTTHVMEEKYKSDKDMLEKPEDGYSYKGYSPAASLADHFRWQMKHRVVLDAARTIKQIEEDHQAMVNEVLVTIGVTAASFLIPPLAPEAAFLVGAMQATRLAVGMHWLIHTPMNEITINSGKNTPSMIGNYNQVRMTGHSETQWEYYKSIALFAIQGGVAAKLNAALGVGRLFAGTALPGEALEGASVLSRLGGWAANKGLYALQELPHTLIGVGAMHFTSIGLDAMDYYRKEGKWPTNEELARYNSNAYGSDAYAMGFDRLAAGIMGRNPFLRFAAAFLVNEGLRAESIRGQTHTESEENRKAKKKKEEELAKTDDPVERRRINNEIEALEEQHEKISYWKNWTTGWLGSAFTHAYFASHAVRPGNESVREQRAKAMRLGDARKSAVERGQPPKDSWENWRREPNDTNGEILHRIEAIESEYGLNPDGTRAREPANPQEAQAMELAENARAELYQQLDAAAGRHLAQISTVQDLAGLRTVAMTPEASLPESGAGPGGLTRRRVQETKKAFDQIAKANGMTPEVFAEALKKTAENIKARRNAPYSAVNLDPRGELQPDGTRLIRAHRETDMFGQALPEVLREAQKSAAEKLKTAEVGTPAYQAAFEELFRIEQTLQATEARSGFGRLEIPMLSEYSFMRFLPRDLQERYMREHPVLAHLPIVGSGGVDVQLRSTFKPTWYDKVPFQHYLDNKEAKENQLPIALATVGAREHIDPERFRDFATNFVSMRTPQERAALTFEKLVELYRLGESGGVDQMVAWYNDNRISPDLIRHVYGEKVYQDFLKKIARERVRDPVRLSRLLEDGADMKALEKELGISHSDSFNEKKKQEAMENVWLGALYTMLMGNPETRKGPTLPQGSTEHEFWLRPIREANHLPADIFDIAVVEYVKLLPPNSPIRNMPMKDVMPGIQAKAQELMFALMTSPEMQSPKTPEQKARRDALADGLIFATKRGADVPLVQGLPVGNFKGGYGKNAMTLTASQAGIKTERKPPTGNPNAPKSAWASEMDGFLHFAEQTATKSPEVPLNEVIARFRTERQLGYHDIQPKVPQKAPQQVNFDHAVAEFQSQTGLGPEAFGGNRPDANAIFRAFYSDWKDGLQVVPAVEGYGPNRRERLHIGKVNQGQQNPALVSSRQAMEQYATYMEQLRVAAGFTKENFGGDEGAARRAFARTYQAYRWGGVRYETLSDGTFARRTNDELAEVYADRRTKLQENPDRAAMEMKVLFGNEEMLRKLAGFSVDSHGSENASRDAFYEYQGRYYSAETGRGKTSEPLSTQAEGIWKLYASEHAAPATPARPTADLGPMAYNPSSKVPLSQPQKEAVTAYRVSLGYTPEKFGKAAGDVFDQAVNFWRAGFSLVRHADGSIGLVRTPNRRTANPLSAGRNFFTDYVDFHDALRRSSGFVADRFGGKEEVAQQVFTEYVYKYVGKEAIGAKIGRTGDTIQTIRITQGDVDELSHRRDLLAQNPAAVAKGIKDLFDAEEFIRGKAEFTADKFGGDENKARETFRHYYEDLYITQGKKVNDYKKVISDTRTPKQRREDSWVTVYGQVRALYRLDHP